MITQDVAWSDDFLDMPATSQNLYFHCILSADDEGFISGLRRIMAMCGASPDGGKLLIAKGFLIPFETGCYAVRHWYQNNLIQADRRHETIFKEERSRLTIDGNKMYTLPDTGCIQDVSDLECEVKLSKANISKANQNDIMSSAEDQASAAPAAKHQRHQYGLYKNVLLTDEEPETLEDEFSDCNERIDRLSEYIASTGRSYKSHLATIRAWSGKDERRPPPRHPIPTAEDYELYADEYL